MYKEKEKLEILLKLKYYKIVGEFGNSESSFKAEWKVRKFKNVESPKLYNETGFKKEEDAKNFIEIIKR